MSKVTSDSAPDKRKVVSKYFSNSVVMEENSFSVKKNTANTSSKKPKSNIKKSTKKVKGQKDIRTLIKSKKNELVTYTKDFNLICKESGIDIDSEQLQLAIALSKSLQDTEADSQDCKSGKPLTANQRKGRIRTTLLEYGFNVPDIKRDVNKRAKRHKKQYKLLLTSDFEKQQSISERYAHVLFANVDISNLEFNHGINFDYSDAHLFKLAADVLYESIKHDEVFYIKGIVEKSEDCKHHMLKDWSEIPGRPVSPKLEVSNISFNSIQCSQEDLDIILSGTIDICQSVIKSNYIRHPVPELEDNKENISNFNLKESTKMDLQYNINDCHQKSSISYDLTGDKILPPNRSCSPDLFDDEVTIIMDDVGNKIAIEEDVTQKTMVREQNDFMDLTECVNIVNYNNLNKQNSCLSQGTNHTRINPNDFMDLTGCVAAYSQRIPRCIQDELNINSNQNGIENYKYVSMEKNEKITTMDLTQSSNSNDRFIYPQVTDCAKNSLDDTIILNDEDYCNINSVCDIKLTPNVSEVINLIDEDCYVPTALKNFTENPSGNLDNMLTQIQKENEVGTHNVNLGTNKQIVNLEHGLSEHPEQNKMKPSDALQKPNEEYEEMDLTQSDSRSNTPPVEMCDEVGRGDSVVDFLDDHYYNLDETANKSNNLHNFHDINAVEPPLPATTENIDLINTVNLDNDNIHQFDIDHPTSNIVDHHTENKGYCKPKQNKNIEVIDTVTIDEDYHINNLEVVPQDLPKSFKFIELHHEVQNRPKDKNKKYNYQSPEINIAQSSDEVGKPCQLYSVEIENDQEFDDMLASVSKSKSKVQENVLSKCLSKDVHFNTAHSEMNAIKNSCNGFSTNDNNSIDLSQDSDTSEEGVVTPEINIVPELGKRNNISIDYDENFIQTHTGHSSPCSLNGSNTSTTAISAQKCIERPKEDVGSSLSQNSEVFDISDDEFNYSVHQNKEENFDLGGMSLIEEFLHRESLARRSESFHNYFYNSDLNSNKNVVSEEPPKVNLKGNVDFAMDYKESTSSKDIASVELSTPSKTISKEEILLAQTPGLNDYIINTDRVTPEPDYERMTTPERNMELDKYGIKPLKRKRAIQMLTHIYDQTHPFMEILPNNEYESPSKKRKTSDLPSPRKKLISIINQLPNTNLNKPGHKLSPRKKGKSPIKSHKPQKSELKEFSSISHKENHLYMETKHVPDLRDIQCSPEEWFFQKREKAKLHSCRVPLHIAFHNYVSCRRLLREAILKYEPINIDAIHKGLVSIGYRYDPKDLLKFMDKKCVTVKTADNNSRNSKK